MAPAKVDQTILHSDPQRPGNCFAACVASALGLSLDDVPHFIEWGMKHYGDHEPDPDGHARAHWHAMMLGFLAGRGLWPVPIASLNDAEPGEVVFVGGPSPRGVPHQVLYRDGVLWHDPHPSKAGLLHIDEEDLWVIRPAGRHDHEPTVALARTSGATEDTRTEQGEAWICDGCMSTASASEVAEWADYEHVLCIKCASPARTSGATEEDGGE